MKRSVTAALAMSALALVPQMTIAAESPTFLDVNENHTHYGAIERVAEYGFINGYSDGTYQPQASISRGHVAVIIARALQLDLPDQSALPKNLFADVTSEHPHAAAIYAVQEAGIMNGREGNTIFAPLQDISREQMASVLVRAFELELIVEGGNQEPITDIDRASEAHQANIGILSQHEITRTSDGNFRPRENVSRGQFASFIDRSLSVQYTEALGITRVQQIDRNTFDVHYTETIENLSPDNFSFTNDLDILDATPMDDVAVIRLVTTDDTFGIEYTLYYQEGRLSFSFIGNGSSDVEGMMPVGTLISDVKKVKGTPRVEDWFMGGAYIFYDQNGYFYDELANNPTVNGYWIGNPTTDIFGAHIGMTPTELNQHFGTVSEGVRLDSEGGMYAYDYATEDYTIMFFADERGGKTTDAIIQSKEHR
ncbi:S-layer homology domain-containing protein [Geomicrobium sp. JCM 19039]|uniref:S-layer homology domain-containing protein n=1 Tax=Geomicrobium sp. JCM 19039 TaxID=1460636 RepID=UPI00045F274F|nr:S-layer homology domain-containing protein [Geomicrobium sp. JCM 19039]GAK10561.1 hypothetical protein JCM19039_186 [Geomicrobium sp. JCM 19039]